MTRCLPTVNGFHVSQQNAGALATVAYGTALGVLRAAKEKGKCVQVVVPETRPALQGSRLTAYELREDGFPVTVVCDTSIGYLMQKERVSKVIVGADRVTTTGHLFNKIGTYQIAILAQKHNIPFYPAVPTSSFDLNSDWRNVVVEERGLDEVAFIRGRRIMPKGLGVFNPVFDVTPPEFITAIITNKGILWPPLEESIRNILLPTI